tara:strand:- start:881 stop:1075 length:195 start_codon:yes stop_codon:yes gene_type:complete
MKNKNKIKIEIEKYAEKVSSIDLFTKFDLFQNKYFENPNININLSENYSKLNIFYKSELIIIIK